MSADGLGEGPLPPAPQESANQWRPMYNVYGAREVTTGMVVQLHLSGCTNREVSRASSDRDNNARHRASSAGALVRADRKPARHSPQHCVFAAQERRLLVSKNSAAAGERRDCSRRELFRPSEPDEKLEEARRVEELRFQEGEGRAARSQCEK